MDTKYKGSNLPNLEVREGVLVDIGDKEDGSVIVLVTDVDPVTMLSGVVVHSDQINYVAGEYLTHYSTDHPILPKGASVTLTQTLED